MIDFSDVKQWWIGQYEVIKAQLNGTDVWEKGSSPTPVEDCFYLTNDDVNPITVSVVKYTAGAVTVSLEVSDDGVTWTTLGDTSTTPLDITIPVGGRKYLRSISANAWGGNGSDNEFSSTGLYGAHGNIMKLLGYDTLKGNDCEWMFYQNTNLTTAPDLPATTLAYRCYYSMFQGCTNLTTAPTLPATVLADYCYSSMFQGCTSLTSITCYATDISATDCTQRWVNGVAASGTFYKYPGMSLWTTGDDGIPSGWLVQDDDDGNFYLTNSGSSVITVYVTKSDANAPTISLEVSDDGRTWTTLGNTSTSDLGITIPAHGRKYLRSTSANAWSNNNQYDNRFSSNDNFGAHGNIMKLLGYDTLKGYDCCRMFHSCTGLTSAPELPATTLAESCYAGMFFYCTGLTTAPTLPATTLAVGCYNSMFSGCTGLTTAPELPATTLVFNCYFYMFNGCTSLTTAPILPATTLVNSCYGGMFRGCSSLSSIMCYAADISASNCTYSWVNGVAASGTFYKNPSMSSWTTGDDGIPSGWTVQDIVGDGFYLTNDDVNPITVSVVKYADDAPTISLEISDDGFTWTTLGDTSTTPLDITIPVGGRKYLRSITDSAWCVNGNDNEFASTGLYGAHGNIMKLLGYDTLKGYDCQYMFYHNANLTTAPELPVTTLAQSCYNGMFQGCTSLTTAPYLPATLLEEACYSWMFTNCSSISSITCNATNFNAPSCTTAWVNGVAASGTFYKNPSMSSWSTGDDGIPSGWTVQDIQ